MVSLEIIAEDPRFPCQDLNSPQPDIRLHAPGFAAKAIVVLAAELLQLGYETGVLASLSRGEGDQTRVGWVALGGSHEMRKA